MSSAGRGHRACRPVRPRAPPMLRPRSRAAARWAGGCSPWTGPSRRSASPAGWPAELRQRGRHDARLQGADRHLLGPRLLAPLQRRLHRPTMGSKHPDVIGPAGPGDVGRDLGGAAGPLFDGVRSHRTSPTGARTIPSCWTGTASSRRPTSTSRTTRSGGDDGSVSGVFCIVSETTGRVLGERRVRTLGALGSPAGRRRQRPGRARRPVAEVLGENRADVPFAAALPGPTDRDGSSTLAGCGRRRPGRRRVPSVRRGPRDRRRVLTADRSDRLPTGRRATCCRSTAADQALVLPVSGGTRRSARWSSA